MSKLEIVTRIMISSTYSDGSSKMPEEVREFVEELTFSPAEEIVDTLRSLLAEDWMALPVWARNVAFRLACLQRQDDSALLREAGADLLSFGPDWDAEANDLLARADRIDREAGNSTT